MRISVSHISYIFVGTYSYILCKWKPGTKYFRFPGAEGRRAVYVFGGCALSNASAEKTTTIALTHHVFFFLCQYLVNYPTDSDKQCGKVNATSGFTTSIFCRNFGP